MPLQSFHIQNFRGFHNIQFQFPKNRSTIVFIGDNGVGKSSLLDAIALNLSHFVDKLMGKNMGEFENTLSYEDIRIGATEDCRIEIEWEIKRVKKDTKESFIVATKSATFLNINQLKPKYEHKELDDLVKRYKKRLEEQSMEELAAIPVLVYYRPERMVFHQDNTFKVNTSEQYDYQQFQTYQDAFSRQLQSFQAFTDWYKKEEDIENESKIKERDFDKKNPNLEAIRTALQSFLNQLPDAHFENLRYERQSITAHPSAREGLYIDKNGEALRLNQLSSGEKMLLLLVADIARRMAMARPYRKRFFDGQAIIIIDEIDLHLHPRWQRQVIPALEQTFPSAQFIITTHSEQVLSNIPNDAVFEVTENGIYSVENTYGKDNHWISQVVMRDTSRPKWVLIELEAIFEAIRLNKMSEAQDQKKALAQKIGEDDSELMKVDMMINRKLKQLI